MTDRIWDKFLTERDRAIFDAAGYGVRAGFAKRPALVVVDVNYGFCGDKREPVLESIKRWRQSAGEAAWDALPILQRLIAAARGREIPVIYTTGVKRSDNWDRGSWSWKNRRSAERPAATNHDPNEIMPQIAPGPRDIVVYKQKPSGFHGTNLLAYLVHLGCDGILLTGTTTSGCVRATAIDAFSYNFRVALIEDGCFDRGEASHAITLFDLNAKYADLVTSDEAVTYLEALPRGLFELPSGNGA